MSLEHSPARARRLGFGRIPRAVTESGLSRSELYKLAAKYKGLFKKRGAATLVDLDMLVDDIIAGLPDANINISSASKPDAA
jgi:hypothetical protein